MPEEPRQKKQDVKLVLLGSSHVGKTSLLHRYMTRSFSTSTVSTIGGVFFHKKWGPYSISIWDTAGRERFHGLGSMYCRGAAAIVLTYDVTCRQSLDELRQRFLSLTDSADQDCIYALVGNKADLTDLKAREPQGSSDSDNQTDRTDWTTHSPVVRKQVTREQAVELYGHILSYKGLHDQISLPADKMCFETSAKTGYNVDHMFETLFDLLQPSILKIDDSVNLEDGKKSRDKPSCCK